MIDYKFEFINRESYLERTVENLSATDAFALDIETINWWSSEAERISLLQLAYRAENEICVVIIDMLAGLDPEPLRHPLELGMQMKIIHNAGFDAVKLARHYSISTSPIHDTMLAARRNGEKHCSLKALADRYLGIQLDKNEQRSDWERRPLSESQLRYAALDAVCTLLLFEKQSELGLIGDYQLKHSLSKTQRKEPPVKKSNTGIEPALTATPDNPASVIGDLSRSAVAVLGIINELSGRYSPEHLAATVSNERVGLAGWIIDRFLGIDADIDGEGIKQLIEELCDYGLVKLSSTRRLEPTDKGLRLWNKIKARES